jgi:NAD(P)-dependent dehydrogenase (short-subunit alcohol dehydrogenase family)
MYVPVGIERVDITRQPGTELWLYSKLRPMAEGRLEQIVGDIMVWDAQGESVAGIEGLAVARTSAEVLHQLFAAQERQPEVLCRLDWRAVARRGGEPPAAAATNLGWMVFADAGGAGAGLAELLRARGDRCVLVRAGDTFDMSDPECWSLNPSEAEHFRRALESARPFDRLVYAWSADLPPSEGLDAGSLGSAQRAGCCGLLHVVQALGGTEHPDPFPQLWVVTRGAQPIGDDRARVNPAQAPVWGLGRTIAQEHPRLWGGMIDLDPDPAPSDADRLLDEIADPEEEDHIAYAGGARYVARLVPTSVAAPAARLRFQADATYLISGGAGGLGRTVARWMLGRGARQLVLVGRAPRTEEIGTLLSELERAGARVVHYEQADVAQEPDVTRVLERIGATMPPLRGIVHAAGVLSDATLLEQSWPRFLQVMAPKIDGSWLLHRLTAHIPLDHFVLFSSSAAILGAAGQGNYAAANSFMDALAHFRHSRGLPALSIDWGPWDEVGMAAAMDPKARAQRASHGLRAFPPDEALRLLERAMLDARPQIGILSVDWGALLAGAAPLLRRSSIFKDLAGASPVAAAPEPAAAPNPVVERFVRAEPAQRQSLAHAYVMEQVMRLLGAESHALDPNEPLTLQGFDSLMALELRDVVETELQISMPILTFFRSNSISELTTYVLGELEKRFAVRTEAPAEEPSAAELLARLDELSEGELDLALRRELER